MPDFDREQGPQELLAALQGLRRRAARVRRRAPVGARRTGGWASCCRTSSSCPAAGVVEDVRAVKEPGEILRIARRRRAGRRDLRLAARVRARRADRARRRGRAGARDARARRVRAVVPARSSPPPSTARCRTRSRATWRSPPDTLVTIDIGAVLDGYCSDCTRTWATGDRCSDELAEAYALVAARAGDGAGRGPARGRWGARSTRSRATSSTAAGHGEHFGHGLGHGVGLVTHEAPRLARSGETRAGGRATS